MTTQGTFRKLFAILEEQVNVIRLDHSTNDITVVIVLKRDKTQMLFYKREDLAEVWAAQPRFVARLAEKVPPDVVPVFILNEADHTILSFSYPLAKNAVVLN